MNFKKMMKRGQEGFTLVELIVVIAILGILGGIAVPAYSGYVEKANKGADQALIGEVQHALALYYYSNPDADLSTAWVKLNQEGSPAEAVDDGAGDLAMKAVFGDDWKESIGLKYADWQGDSSSVSYSESSYYGHEAELIGTVDSLTSALGKVIAEQRASGNDLMGKKFTDFLSEKGVAVDSEKGVGNAAVLYIAENTVNTDPEVIQNAFTTGINNSLSSGDPGSIAGAVFTQLQKDLGNAGAMAAIYAYAEGYAQYSGQADAFHAGNDKFANVTDPTSAVAALAESFKSLENPADASKSFVNYVQNGNGQKDLQAYIDMMNTVYNNQDMVSGNLESDTCFTDGTVENMLKGHAAMGSMSVTNPDGTVSIGLTTGDGQVAVGLAVDTYGVVSTPVNPPNWNK